VKSVCTLYEFVKFCGHFVSLRGGEKKILLGKKKKIQSRARGELTTSPLIFHKLMGGAAAKIVAGNIF
tara:strand:+ start:461 stop:664 length:204 start_codon:yes stop_codon:yes gene_type:complete